MILSSLSFAAILAMGALVLGSLLGAYFIRRSQRPEVADWSACLSLGLDLPRP